MRNPGRTDRGEVIQLSVYAPTITTGLSNMALSDNSGFQPFGIPSLTEKKKKIQVSIHDDGDWHGDG